MGDTTSIGWTDHTFNAWEGCSRVSPGCQNCYAEDRAHRYRHEVWGKGRPRMVRVDTYWRKPFKWNRDAETAGRPALVFCSSLADVFEDHNGAMVGPDGQVIIGRSVRAERARLFGVIEATPWLRWQLLTKRPENVRRLVPPGWLNEDGDEDVSWPSNVWIGTTVEDQQRAEERIPHLLTIPAPVRFLSCEPLLGPLDLRAEWLELELQAFGAFGARCFPRVDWIIAGGESGNGSSDYRPLDVDHARGLRDRAVEYAVPFFFKQHGGFRSDSGGRLLDGEEWNELPGRFVQECEELGVS